MSVKNCKQKLCQLLAMSRAFLNFSPKLKVKGLSKVIWDRCLRKAGILLPFDTFYMNNSRLKLVTIVCW